MRTGFLWVYLGDRGHLGDTGVDGRIIKMDFQEMGIGNMEWTDLAQDRDRWRLLVNVVMNLWVP